MKQTVDPEPAEWIKASMMQAEDPETVEQTKYRIAYEVIWE